MNGHAHNAIIDQKSGRIIVQQSLPPFNCLVLEGAGVRGTAYPGAFKVLSTFGLSKDIEHVAGSSAGAIAALLYALGYSQEEIAYELYHLPMEEFTEKSAQLLITPTFWSQAKMALQILRSKDNALSSGQVMQNWLEERVKRKLGKKDATFADLKAKVESQENLTAKDPVKYLYVTATNISLNVPESEVFSHQKSPDVSIATAVRASGTFPYIFAAVDINGCKYFDGGSKNNLPCNIFDNDEFLPDGFAFNDKGLNPGVFAIKIDSRDEINQVIWGIRKHNKIESIGEYTSAVAHACTDNIDANEMRNARTVLALSDQGFGSLNFTIGTDGKLSLCSSAENASQEFLENMIGTAYKVKTYESIISWLDTLSLDELHQVIAQYRTMPTTTINTITTPNNGPLGFDPSNPSAQDIQKYIKYIEDYTQYRIDKFQTPDAKFKPDAEPRHINLPPSHTNQWEKLLTNNMSYRIDVMRRNIKQTEEKISAVLAEFSEDDENSLVQRLHDDSFDTIKLLAGYVEYRDILSDEVAELEMKLGKRTSCYPPETYNDQYHLFANTIAEHANGKSISSALKAIVASIDVLNPIITHKSLRNDDNVLFSYYLRNTLDCKIFMIAMILYLEHRKAKELPVLEKLYSELFSGKKCPKSMYALSSTFPELKTSSLLVHAYRIEELLLFFARTENPNNTPDINLDKIFDAHIPLLKLIFPKAKGNKSSNMDDLSKAIPMHNFFRVKTPSPDKDRDTASRQYRAEHK